LIGLTSLWIDGRPRVSPEINPRRAVFVLGKIDEILSWEKTRIRKGTCVLSSSENIFVRSGRSSTGNSKKLASFDNFLEKRFPASRRKAYYLMAIHENLTRIPKPQLRAVGWSKATELVKVARKDGGRFDCATWLHRARELPKEGFKNEVERYLTGKETEPWEIIYFQLYKSQLPVVERALETTALMLGTDKSRGYCLEMTCADFLAGSATQENQSEVLVLSLERLYQTLPDERRGQLLDRLKEGPWKDCVRNDRGSS